MPGTTTHNYILYKALTTYAANSPIVSSVKKSNELVTKYAKKKDYKKYRSDDICVTAGCCYLGCFGPDLFYVEFGETGKFIADLMHYNKAGLFMIWCLRQVKQCLPAAVSGFRPDLLHLFAYCMGHICHIAADIIVHPYVNSIVGAYPDNPEAFENARGSLKNNIWKFHNILEHYQDSYVLHNLFFEIEGFGQDWETVNIARAAANYYMKKSNRNERFLMKNCKEFYKFTHKYKDVVEEDKYRFFENSNWLLDFEAYYNQTIPSKKTMENAQILVQGWKYGLFDQYIAWAVAQTHIFWAEIEYYLASHQNSYDDNELTEDKVMFPQLRRHWNLDCGMSPEADSSTRSWAVPQKKDTTLNIAGTLRYKSVHSAKRPDVV
jgi:hypothetical protein